MLRLNINNSIILFLILLTCVFNQFSWISFFDSDQTLSLTEKFIFGFFDALILLIAILCFFYGYKLIFFNFFLILILIGILEIIFGDWLFKDRLNHLNIIKDHKMKFAVENLYDWHEDNVEYKRDIYGFRSKYKSLDDIDIITIGGSTTDQRFIGEGFTYQDIIHKLFSDDNKYISVVNAGVDGQTTHGHIKNFDYWFKNIPSLKPKYFLFFIGVNDLYSLNPGEHDYILENDKRDLELGFLNKIRSNSVFYYLINLASGLQKAKIYNLGHGYKKSYPMDNWTTEFKINNHEIFISHSLDSFEARLHVLVDKVKQYGAQTIFVTQSHRRIYDIIDGQLYGEKDYLNLNGIDINGTDYYYMIKLVHQRMLKVAKKEGAIFLDLNNELQFDLLSDFYDHCHFTPSGAKKIGEYIYKNLKQHF